ncbi:MAG: hypothetical protein ABIQ36_05030 [Rhodanobacter sp.]
MKSTSLFRAVLLGSLFSAIMEVIAGISLSSTLPPLLQQYLAQDANAPFTGGDAVTLLTLVAVIIVMLIATIGLWRFRRWAKTLWIFLTIVTLIASPLLGPTVTNGWEGMFSDLSLTLDGIVIAMLFSGETGRHFSAVAVQAHG